MSDATPGSAHPSPSSWRDTYDLVRDARLDVLTAVGVVDGKVDLLAVRVNAIEAARSREAGHIRAAVNIAGITRSTIALIVSIVSAVFAFVAIARM